MKVYISADMEGVTGVTYPGDVLPGHPAYERFRKLLTADVNAAIEGAVEGGATRFVVNEAHDGMRNILIEELDDRVEIIIGRQKPYVMMEGIEGADVVFFVGYHAGAGTAGVLSHTFLARPVVAVELNGEPCSEGRMNAVLAGLEGVAVGLVSGDDLTCQEAEKLYPGVRTAQTKTAVGRYVARCLSPKASHNRIRDQARSAVMNVEGLSSLMRWHHPIPLPSSSPLPARRLASSTFRSSSA